MPWIDAQTAKLHRDVDAANRKLAIVQALAAVPPLAALEARLVVFQPRELWLVLDTASRADSVAQMEALTAQIEPLPIVATRGTYARIKPACDYTAEDGDIKLDAQYALPFGFDIEGFGAREGRNKERLYAWFETETERVRVSFESPARATCQLIYGDKPALDQRQKNNPSHWQWSGLPAYNQAFFFASGSRENPGSVSLAFDTSTDLTAWLSVTTGTRTVNL